MNIHKTLVHVLTEYDRKQSKKKSYNYNALGLYFQRLEDVEKDIAAGADVRAAIVAGFSGRLADTCLRSLGLPITTKEEAFGGMTYKPVALK